MLRDVWTWIKFQLREGWYWLWSVKWFRRVVYGLGTLIVLVIVFYAMAIFDVFGLNTEEEGWQSGPLADYKVTNRLFTCCTPAGWFFPTGEGYLVLGNANSRGARVNGKTVSPSYFSTSTHVWRKSQNYVSQPVAMHYRRLVRTWFLGGATDVRVNDFEKLVPAPIPDHCAVSHDLLNKGYGTMGGIIVEVAKVGDPLLWKTYEVLVHTGGNDFPEMSITDEHMYECAITALGTGQTVVISYDNNMVRNPTTQRTSINIIGISNQK